MRGIYHVQFQSNMGSWGAGTVSLENGLLRGGDNAFHYEGSWKSDSQQINAHVKVTQKAPGPSVFGYVSQFNLNLTGNLTDEGAILRGYRAEAKNQKIEMILTKIPSL